MSGHRCNVRFYFWFHVFGDKYYTKSYKFLSLGVQFAENDLHVAETAYAAYAAYAAYGAVRRWGGAAVWQCGGGVVRRCGGAAVRRWAAAVPAVFLPFLYPSYYFSVRGKGLNS